MPLIDLLQSAMNHITAHIAGDRSEAHISQAIWNLLNYLQISIWVTLGFRPKELNKLPNHRADWKPGDEPANPLSPQEIEWLQFKGVLPKHLGELYADLEKTQPGSKESLDASSQIVDAIGR
jgi:hypothetical protein